MSDYKKGEPGAYHDKDGVLFVLEHNEDGLALPRLVRIWLNPPYGREQRPFRERMVERSKWYD